MLSPFWRYYGGKWRAAPRYEPPRFDTIVEPFAGAAGYSLRHHRRRVILVEKHEAICELWRFLISASAAEIMAIPLVDSVDDLPTVALGARHLVGFAMNSGSVGPRRSLSIGSREMREQGRMFEGWSEQKRLLVARQVEQIKHWTIIEGDYTMAPAVEATWFIDPPYQVAGVHYKHSSRAIDYAALGEWCRDRRGQVMVCEAEGATWLPFRAFASLKAGIGTEGARDDSVEVIWTSGDSQPRLF